MGKKFLIIYILLILSNIGYAKDSDKLDVNSAGFIDLSNYAEKVKSKPAINEEMSNEQAADFEQQAIKEVAKRYENNAVELKLDDIDDSAVYEVNENRLFKLHVNETQYKIESSIKAENMIWDTSKQFSNAVVSSSRYMAPIPAVVNSQSIEAKVSPSLSASIGQTYLFDSLGPSVLFVRTNESTYNTGSVISYKGEGLNLAVGSFSSSYNNAASGGAILTSNSINLPKSSGSFLVGSAFFSNEAQNCDKTTGGLFGEYAFKRLKLNAQVGQSKYSNSADYDTSFYFVPELRLSDSLYLKTRFIRNVSQETMQDELAITYKPKKNKNNLEIELNASSQYDNNSIIKQRLKLSTTFRI